MWLVVVRGDRCVCVQWLLLVWGGGCDSPEKWLELCITKRILRPFAAHAYISAQIAIRGPSNRPTELPSDLPSDRPSGSHDFAYRANGKTDENVMRSLSGLSGKGVGGGVRE